MLRQRHQEGQVLVAFAISMSLLFFGMLASALDVNELENTKVVMSNSAVQAAATGASNTTQGSVQNGAPLLAPTAIQKCQQAGDAYSHIPGSTSCRVVYGNQIEATVTRDLNVTIPLFGKTFTISSSDIAAPVVGGTQPVA